MEIKIEKGIPLPARYEEKYPFKDMEVGDSFFVKPEPGQGLTSLQSQVSASYRHFVEREGKSGGSPPGV